VGVRHDGTGIAVDEYLRLSNPADREERRTTSIQDKRVTKRNPQNAIAP